MDKYKVGDIIFDTTFHDYSPILIISQQEMSKHSIHIIPKENYGYKTTKNYYSSGNKSYYDKYELFSELALHLYFEG